MFGMSNDVKEPPLRTVWADDTLIELTYIRDSIKELREKEAELCEKCNHTYKDGRSALQQHYDSENESYYTSCEVCKRW